MINTDWLEERTGRNTNSAPQLNQLEQLNICWVPRYAATKYSQSNLSPSYHQVTHAWKQGKVVVNWARLAAHILATKKKKYYTLIG